jgi:hypothetical protein
MGSDGVACIGLVHGRDEERALLNALINLRAP